MGSLPNLHELGCKKINIPVNNEALAKAINQHNQKLKYEDHKRNSCKPNVDTHKQITHTRSLGSNPHEIIISKHNNDKPALSSRISRNIRSSSVVPYQFHNATLEYGGRRISRQASVSNSMGSSSIHKLISAIKSTPSQCGPIYSRQSIWQNFITLCLVHGMFTLSYMPIVILQSSVSSWWLSSKELSPNGKINITNSSNIGSLLLSGLYLVGAISAIVSPFASYRIGITRCLLLSFIGNLAFTLTHLHPVLYVLIPGYVIMGISIANINYTKTAYMIVLASKLKLVLSEQEKHELRDKSENGRKEMLTVKLFGWVSLSKNIGLVLGGILTYYLIQFTTTDTTKHEAENQDNQMQDSLTTFQNSKYDDKVCGYDTCRIEFLSSNIFAMPDDDDLIRNMSSLILPCKTSAMLAAVYVGFSAVAVVVSVFMHRSRVRHQYSQFQRIKFSNILHTTCETLKYKKLQFMIPLMIFIGIEQGFMYADFSKLYVICVMGIETTPLIFISLGLLQSIAAVTLSLLVSHIKRYYIVGIGFIFQACLLLSLIMWKPKTDDVGLFYVISSAWGVCNAIWETIAFCLLLALFPDCWEFPFAHCYFFRYLGLSAAFAYHEHLCTSVKLYLMSFMLLISVIPYVWLEIQLISTTKTVVRGSSISSHFWNLKDTKVSRLPNPDETVMETESS